MAHHAVLAAQGPALDPAHLDAVFPGGLLGLPEDGGQVHRLVLGEQAAQLLAHPRLDLLTVATNLDRLPLIPWIIQMLHLRINSTL